MRALSLMLLVLLPLGACSLSMQLPATFLVLEGDGGYRAMTGDDGRVWVREFDDPDDGNLSFWTEALRDDLLRNRGYQLTREGPVRDGAGRAGHLLECTATLEGERHGYLVAVFALPGGWFTGSAVRVCEFTAREEVYARHVDAVRLAIPTLRP